MVAAMNNPAEFVREDRYIVIKRSDVDKFWRADVREQFMAALDRLNAHHVRIPQRAYVVVESDWPEYALVWQLIEARVSGQGGDAFDYDTLRTANQRLEGEVARLRDLLSLASPWLEDAAVYQRTVIGRFNQSVELEDMTAREAESYTRRRTANIEAISSLEARIKAALSGAGGAE
jgi:hypothetical protein